MITKRRIIRTVIDIQIQVLQDKDLKHNKDQYHNPSHKSSNKKNDPAMHYMDLLLLLKLKLILPPKEIITTEEIIL